MTDKYVYKVNTLKQVKDNIVQKTSTMTNLPASSINTISEVRSSMEGSLCERDSTSFKSSTLQSSFSKKSSQKSQLLNKSSAEFAPDPSKLSGFKMQKTQDLRVKSKKNLLQCIPERDADSFKENSSFANSSSEDSDRLNNVSRNQRQRSKTRKEIQVQEASGHQPQSLLGQGLSMSAQNNLKPASPESFLPQTQHQQHMQVSPARKASKSSKNNEPLTLVESQKKQKAIRSWQRNLIRQAKQMSKANQKEELQNLRQTLILDSMKDCLPEDYKLMSCQSISLSRIKDEFDVQTSKLYQTQQLTFERPQRFSSPDMRQKQLKPNIVQPQEQTRIKLEACTAFELQEPDNTSMKDKAVTSKKLKKNISVNVTVNKLEEQSQSSQELQNKELNNTNLNVPGPDSNNLYRKMSTNINGRNMRKSEQLDSTNERSPYNRTSSLRCEDKKSKSTQKQKYIMQTSNEQKSPKMLYQYGNWNQRLGDSTSKSGSQQNSNSEYQQSGTTEFTYMGMQSNFTQPRISIKSRNSSISKKEREYKQIKQYKPVKTIGRSPYGLVYLCKNLDEDDANIFVLREYNRANLKKPDRGNPVDQGELDGSDSADSSVPYIEALAKLEHRSIAKIYDIIDDPENKMTYIVTDSIAGVTLERQLTKIETGFSEIEALSYFRQLLSAIKYCHEQHPKVHLDIKLENMKFRQYGARVVVCDFRMSEFLQVTEDESAQVEAYNQIRYMPPESLDCEDDRQLDQTSIDVWLAGVALFMFLTNEYPFDDSSIPKCINQLNQNKPKLDKIENLQIREMLRTILEKDPLLRPTPDNILQNPLFLQLEGEELNRMNPIELGGESIQTSVLSADLSDSRYNSSSQAARKPKIDISEKF